VIKYVPTDVVAAWTAVLGIVKSAQNVPSTVILWVCYVVGIILTWFWTRQQTKTSEGKADVVTAWQSGVATVAFVVWAFAIGGAPFDSLPFYHPIYGSLALIAFTLISGLVVPREGAGKPQQS
jgi:hypothetical protein